MKIVKILTALMVMAVSVFGLTQKEKEQIATEAYIYTYPLVLMDITKKQMTNTPADTMPSRGPINQFNHLRAFPPGSFREVVRPNFDTLYSIAWVDLSKEPMILEAPAVKDRFYMLPMYDMWTDTFAVVGSYANGANATKYALCNPQWKGKLPKGVKRIDAPTPSFWIIGRIQTNGAKDYPYIHSIQDKLKLTPLSQYGKKYKKPPFKKDPGIDDKTAPLLQVKKMSAKEYFGYAMALMKKNPPHITDMVMVERMNRLGLNPENFSWNKLDAQTKKALEFGITNGYKEIEAYTPKLGQVVNGWQMVTKSIGVYGNDYYQRAAIALVGLGANPYTQAIYPLSVSTKEGKVMQGGKKYVIHFDKDKIPPVDAFWSITMYDKDGFPVENSIKRHAIGDRDALKFNKDGSLDILIQPNPPKDTSNWLPNAKSGTVSPTMRLYLPHPEVFSGKWQPPYIEEVK